jgi:hypothetical protein
MEPSLGIIAGCAATMRPLFKAWKLGLGSSKRSMQGNSGLTRARTFEAKGSAGSCAIGVDGESNGSDVELNNTTRRYSAEARASRIWDLERGDAMILGRSTTSSSLINSPILVHTSIDIVSKPDEGTRPLERVASMDRPLYPRPPIVKGKLAC